jgi:hypothetical protein
MSMRRMGIEEARPKLGDLATEAAVDGTVTILLSHRKPIAAIVPLWMIPGDPPSEHVD